MIRRLFRYAKDAALWVQWNPVRAVVLRLPASILYALAVPGAALLLLAGAGRKLRPALALIPVPDGRQRGWLATRRVLFRALLHRVCGELEVLKFPALHAGNIESFVRCAGIERLDEARSAGRGVLLLFAHFGANQMIMPAIGYRGYPMAQLSSPATVWTEVLPGRRFSAMEQRTLKQRWEHEQSLPVKHINIFGSMKEAFLVLRRNEVLGVAADGGGGRNRVRVPFLGRDAFISAGAAEFAIRTGCVVLPVFMVREGTRGSRMAIEPALEWDASRSPDDQIRQILTTYLRRLSEYVSDRPDLYVNFLALRMWMATQGDAPLFGGPPHDGPAGGSS